MEKTNKMASLSINILYLEGFFEQAGSDESDFLGQPGQEEDSSEWPENESNGSQSDEDRDEPETISYVSDAATAVARRKNHNCRETAANGNSEPVTVVDLYYHLKRYSHISQIEKEIHQQSQFGRVGVMSDTKGAGTKTLKSKGLKKVSKKIFAIFWKKIVF